MIFYDEMRRCLVQIDIVDRNHTFAPLLILFGFPKERDIGILQFYFQINLSTSAPSVAQLLGRLPVSIHLLTIRGNREI